VALQALSAVLGGTQSLHCNGKDEALALPTAENAATALRTQQILLHESGVANAVDPVGGSYTIETRTNAIEAEASALLDRIEALGGTLAAIETGYIQREIRESAYRAQQAIDSGAAVVVGVNKYTDEAAASGVQVFSLDPEMEQEQIGRLRALRSSRSEQAWRQSLDAVALAARGGDNLVPPVIAAVEQRATVGEIADTLRRIFGEYQGAE
jgi:methylmalonyl-CoA mutase N-terminal domain/subunit